MPARRSSLSIIPVPAIAAPSQGLTLQGFGAHALDNLPPAIYTVSSLTGTGAGTFIDALAQLNAGFQGTIKFTASGTINLGTQIRLVTGASNFFIDGRGADITFSIGTVWFDTCANFAVANVRHRGGWNAGQSADNFTAVVCNNFAYANISASGSFDEGISSTRNSSNYTLQDCLFGPGGDATHNFGSLNYGHTAFKNGPASFLRNGWSAKDYRNPKCAYHGDPGDGDPSSSTPSPNAIDYDVVNNVAWDCNYALSAVLGAKVNNTNPFNLRVTNPTEVNTGGAIGAFPVPAFAQVAALSPAAARAWVLANGGCNPQARDAFDINLLSTL